MSEVTVNKIKDMPPVLLNEKYLGFAYGDRQTRAWLLRRGVSIKDIEGAYLRQQGISIINGAFNGAV